jgi:hypothetical protein
MAAAATLNAKKFCLHSEFTCISNNKSRKRSSREISFIRSTRGVYISEKERDYTAMLAAAGERTQYII